MQYSNLQQGRLCAGCSSSVGERKVAKWLSDNNIIYAAQYTFNDLRSDKGRKLRFDFAIFKSDGKELLTLLEYNGIQHDRPVDFAGKGEEWAKRQFDNGKIRDQLKIDYCKSHDILLLSIKYDQNIAQVLQDNLL
jgi:hypothetical protein